MRISGYGEFQQMRKLVQKDEAQNGKDKAGNDNHESAGIAAGDSDAVQISAAARQKAKLRGASDFREAKVADVREKMLAGTLVTPESLKRGTSKMLDSLIGGDL